MLRGRTTVAARKRLSVVVAAAAWIAACSSGIDGYYLQTHSHGGTSDGATSATSGGDTNESGGSPSGGGEGGTSEGGTGARRADGGGADTNTGGATLMTTGGAPGVGGTGVGGAGKGGGGSGGVTVGGAANGGSGATASGGRAGAGGVGTGDAGAGGVGTGGVASGGKGGTGGDGAGGVGAGGVGTGGASTGGVGTGGVGTGGASTGGSGGMSATGDPTSVKLDTTLAGITAAAWESAAQRFYLLEAGSHRFWAVDPASGNVTGPFATPAGTVAQNAFGASAQYVYVIAGSSVYRLPHTGYTNQTGVSISLPASATGAYSNGYFLIGDAGGGKTAQALDDTTVALDTSAKNMGAIYAVASDSANLAFVTRDIGTGDLVVNRVPATGTFTANKTPCQAGSTGTTNAISVYGQTVAWLISGEESHMLLYFGDIVAGVCSTSPSLIFGSTSTGPPAIGLIDSNSALVVSDFAGSGTGTLVIERRNGQPSQPLTGVFFGGSTYPRSIIVGGAHYAAVVSGNEPAIISF